MKGILLFLIIIIMVLESRSAKPKDVSFDYPTVMDRNGTRLKIPKNKTIIYQTDLSENRKYFISGTSTAAARQEKEISVVGRLYTNKEKSQSNRLRILLAPRPRHIQGPAPTEAVKGEYVKEENVEFSCPEDGYKSNRRSWKAYQDPKSCR